MRQEGEDSADVDYDYFVGGVFQLIEKLKLCPLAAADGCSTNYLNIVVFK